MQRRYEVSDEQWNKIKHMFPKAKTRRPGLMFNAVLWITCSGAPWRDLPKRFGSWKTVYSRFCKWRDEEILHKVFEHLKKDAAYENLSIYSTAVRAYQSSADSKKGAENSEVNQHIGISSGGKTTKIHAVVDELGNPVYIKLTAGQIHDSTQAIEILLNIKGGNILADKAYGTQEIRKYIEDQEAKYTIPPKSNTKDKLWNAFSTGLNSTAE